MKFVSMENFRNYFERPGFLKVPLGRIFVFLSENSTLPLATRNVGIKLFFIF